MKRKIYNRLLEWKEKNIKKPYMLIGPRQVGKTYILDKFCKNEFEDYLYLNLDSMLNIKEIFDNVKLPEEIIKQIEINLSININIEKTVIFIDEIQVSERAISSLKYFNESEVEYKIVTAGSLLRSCIK